MADIIIGSARSDENGKYSGGKDGDQKQKNSANDMAGEVSMQKMYTHKKGWIVLRPKDAIIAGTMACNMIAACNNKNIGYDQWNRNGIIQAKDGINTKTPTECDCSTLVRAVIKASAGVDPGNFTTFDEKDRLNRTGLFMEPFAYVSQKNTPLFNGDVLVTKTKGHTAIVTSGNPRNPNGQTDKKETGKKKAVKNQLKNKLADLCAVKSEKKYFAKYTGNGCSIVEALAEVGEKDTSKMHRARIAKANGITNYTGTAVENGKLLKLLKKGKLVRP